MPKMTDLIYDNRLGFMPGPAFGVYLGEKYFQTRNDSFGLEDLYTKNDLGEVWNDIKY